MPVLCGNNNRRYTDLPRGKEAEKRNQLIDDLEKQLTAVSDAIGSDLSDKTAQAVEFTKEHRITAEEMQRKADMFKAKLETASDGVNNAIRNA